MAIITNTNSLIVSTKCVTYQDLLLWVNSEILKTGFAYRYYKIKTTLLATT